MPMTQKQLAEVGEDYAKFLPIKGKVVACEAAFPSTKSKCDICGAWLTYQNGAPLAAKQIVVVPQGQFGARHYRLLVCRIGTACRRRRNKQIEYPPERKPGITRGCGQVDAASILKPDISRVLA